VYGGAGCLAYSGVLQFSGGGGSGAFGTFQVVGGGVANVLLIDGGSQYTSQPSVSAVGCPSAVLSAVLSSYVLPSTRGLVTNVVLVADGVGCGSGQGQVTFTGGGGSGAAATYVLVGGKISKLTVSNGGSSYLAPPSATISACPSAVLKVSISLDAGDSGISGISSLSLQMEE